MEQFDRRPLVIGQACGNGWSALHPVVAERTNGQFQTQAFVKVAEVVKSADQIHTCDQGFRLLRQIAGTTYQGADPLAKGGVETFNESSIDTAPAVGAGVTPLPCVAWIRHSTKSFASCTIRRSTWRYLAF